MQLRNAMIRQHENNLESLTCTFMKNKKHCYVFQFTILKEVVVTKPVNQPTREKKKKKKKDRERARKKEQANKTEKGRKTERKEGREKLVILAV